MGAGNQFDRGLGQSLLAERRLSSFDTAWNTNPLWKSCLDKSLAAVSLLFFTPLILMISIIVYFTQGKGIIYRSIRIGENERPFACLKFRTMVPDADSCLEEFLCNDISARDNWIKYRKLENDPRVTCIGRFLRKSSLDELPQLWNVLRGEMSIVGPRPIMADEATKYGSDFKYYLATRPGITGLWQVNGRSDANYDARVQLDKSYVQNRSLLLDLKIILTTVRVVLLQKGAR